MPRQDLTVGGSIMGHTTINVVFLVVLSYYSHYYLFHWPPVTASVQDSVTASVPCQISVQNTCPVSCNDWHLTCALASFQEKKCQ